MLLVQRTRATNAETDVLVTRPVGRGGAARTAGLADSATGSGSYVRAFGPTKTNVLWLARGGDRDSPAWGRAREEGGPAPAMRPLVAAASSSRCRARPQPAESTHPPRSSSCCGVRPWPRGPWPLPPQELVRCGAVSYHARAVLAVCPPLALRSTSTAHRLVCGGFR